MTPFMNAPCNITKSLVILSILVQLCQADFYTKNLIKICPWRIKWKLVSLRNYLRDKDPIMSIKLNVILCKLWWVIIAEWAGSKGHLGSRFTRSLSPINNFQMKSSTKRKNYDRRGWWISALTWSSFWTSDHILHRLINAYVSK